MKLSKFMGILNLLTRYQQVVLTLHYSTCKFREINLDFSVRALDGFESTMGNLRIVDVGNVFRRIFELLGFMSTDIYVEIRFHGKILTFSRT